jgi:hypothetical protein
VPFLPWPSSRSADGDLGHEAGAQKHPGRVVHQIPHHRQAGLITAQFVQNMKRFAAELVDVLLVSIKNDRCQKDVDEFRSGIMGIFSFGVQPQDTLS